MGDTYVSSFWPLSNHVSVGMQVIVIAAVLLSFQVAMAKLHLTSEAKRRWQHLLTGRALVVISYVLPIALCVPLLWMGAFGIYYVRFYHTSLYMEHFGPLLRPHEKATVQQQQQSREGRSNYISQLPGAFYFLVGTALVASWFPLDVARYAVDCLSVADPMAAWIGQTHPVIRLNASSSLSGCVACFVAAWMLGYLYFGATVVDDDSFWSRQIAVGALACTVAEAFPVGNDNLLIPLVTAAAHQYL